MPKMGLEKSGWKWLGSYALDFLRSAPVMIVVVGDPKKTGVDMFMEESPMGYQAACAAAIQNMHLTANALGLGSLWFTLFEKKAIREILGIPPEKIPLALICIGKPRSSPTPPSRKGRKKDNLSPLIFNRVLETEVYHERIYLGAILALWIAIGPSAYAGQLPKRSSRLL